MYSWIHSLSLSSSSIYVLIIECVLILVENRWRPNWREIGKSTINLILEASVVITVFLKTSSGGTKVSLIKDCTP